MAKKKAKPGAAPASQARRPTTAKPAALVSGKPVKVRATRLGYANDERKRVGDVFEIPGDRFPAGHKKAGELVYYSANWMEMVDSRVPLKTTGPQAALNRELHRVEREKAGHGDGPGSDESVSNAEVLGS